MSTIFTHSSIKESNLQVYRYLEEKRIFHEITGCVRVWTKLWTVCTTFAQSLSCYDYGEPNVRFVQTSGHSGFGFFFANRALYAMIGIAQAAQT